MSIASGKAFCHLHFLIFQCIASTYPKASARGTLLMRDCNTWYCKETRYINAMSRA